MLYCDSHFEIEFLAIEKRIKCIGIILLTFVTTFFLNSYSIFHKLDLVHDFIISAIGVTAVWLSIRYLVFIFRKILVGNKYFTIRLILQILASIVVAIGIILLLYYIDNKIVDYGEQGCQISAFFIKQLALISMIYALLVNTIYESFYLFLKLSETAIENEKYKKETIEAQYQNLTSRLNPHFLFNSLNTLSTVVEEDPQKAVAYIQELSTVYRYVLNSQKNTWTDLPSEIKFTQSYIVLLKMRFEENLQIHLDICEKHIQYFILPLTLQLLIENAVKHNEISDEHVLYVKIYCKDDTIVVENNKQKRNIIPSSTKEGLHNITERYRFLVNKEVIVEDNEKQFIVRIPLIKLNNTTNNS